MEISKSKKRIRTKIQLELAQFFTPAPIAKFMSTMFINKTGQMNILDPGAGLGILGTTLFERLKRSGVIKGISYVEFDKPTYEILNGKLKDTVAGKFATTYNEDFIDLATEWSKARTTFTHIVLNPPYFKLRVDSVNSKKLQHSGIHITNIYAAFVWLSARLLAENGELVAIIPRSFCNGPYFFKFREFLSTTFSIESIHIFNSRTKAFSEENVLQENIILHISKRKQVKNVSVSYSDDHKFSNLVSKSIPFDKIVHPDDKTKTIHIPGKDQHEHLNEMLSGALSELGLNVSTGPVVDFRLKDSILNKPTKGTVPLLYSMHMDGLHVKWPLKHTAKKGQCYIPGGSWDGSELTALTDKNVLPLNGYYVVVRRFSSKEERRRIFASVVTPHDFNANYVTFENHLNYYHSNKQGMKKDLAYGLWAYLNSAILDEQFRKISGHTQVNVNDLRNIPYPSMANLRQLGVYVQNHKTCDNDIVREMILGDRA